MNKILEKIKKNKESCILVLVVFIFCTVFLFGISKSTYSIAEDNEKLSLVCSKVVGKNEKINCKVLADFDYKADPTLKVLSINANYEIPEELQYDIFALPNSCQGDDCLTLFASSMNGFAVGNLNGIKEKNEIGEISFIATDKVVPGEKYTINLKNIEVSDSNFEMHDLENVSAEVRIKSEVATLDSVTVNDGELHEFLPEEYEYKVEVEDEVDKAIITYTKTDVNSTATGTGIVGNQVSLHYGSNPFNIHIVSEDGTNTLDYTIVIKRHFDFEPEKYQKYDDYLYVGNASDDEILSSLSMENSTDNITYAIKDNKLNIMYGDEVVEEFTLLRFNVKGYIIADKVVYITEDITYLEFMDIIEAENLDIEFVDTKDNEVAIDGTVINESNRIKVSYNDELVDTYQVKMEYYNVSDDLSINDELKIIGRLPEGMTYSELKEKFKTSGIISIISHDDEKLDDDSIVRTNDKIKIKLSNKEFIYTLSVLGDITGDGKIELADVDLLYRMVTLEDKFFDLYDFDVTDACKMAGQIVQDGDINVNDVNVLYQYFTGTIDSLEGDFE